MDIFYFVLHIFQTIYNKSISSNRSHTDHGEITYSVNLIKFSRKINDAKKYIVLLYRFVYFYNSESGDNTQMNGLGQLNNGSGDGKADDKKIWAGEGRKMTCSKIFIHLSERFIFHNIEFYYR